MKRLINLEPAHRLYQLSRLSVFYDISPQAILNIFPKEYWPIPFLDRDSLIFTNYADLPAALLYVPPFAIRKEIARLVDNSFLNKGNYEGFFNKWVSDPCIALFAIDPIEPIIRSITIRGIRSFYSFLLGTLYHLSAIRFLNPPWDGNPPLLQPIYDRFDIPEYTSSSFDELLTKTIESPSALVNFETILLVRQMNEFFGSCPHITNFPSPFEQSYAYEDSYFNLKHEGVQVLFRILAKIFLLERHNELSALQLGQLKDAANNVLDKIPDRYKDSQKDYDNWTYHLRNLGETTERLGISSPHDTKKLIPAFNEFVPGSLEHLDIKLHFTKTVKEFGQVL